MKIYSNIKTVLKWVILAFIICQAATSTAGMWIALIIGFYIVRFVLRLFISAVYLFCMAIINYNDMETLNKNGVSITQTPGEEKYVKCYLGAFRGQIYFQYDYRHTDIELFSTVAKTLAECRRQRDEWIAKKEKKQ